MLPPYQHSMFIRASLYYVYVKDWLAVFRRDQIYFVHAEEFFNQRSPIIKRILTFLGLDHRLITGDNWRVIADKPPTNVGVLKGRLGDGMLNVTRMLLDQFFRPYNEMLAKLLNDTRFLWR